MINRVVMRLKNFIQVSSYSFKSNVKLHYKVQINEGTSLEGLNVIHANVNIRDSKIGYGTYIASDCSLPRTKIGKYCSIASGVKIIVGNHPSVKIVSTHPLFYASKAYCGQTYSKSDIFDEFSYCDSARQFYCEIGNDVWIASNATLMSGIKIGDGAIIATGAVVTKDVEPYSIVGGVPAKVVKYRFEKEQIDKLNQLQWWHKSEEWIKANIDRFADIELFLNKTVE